MLEDVRRGVRGFVEAGVAAVSGALTPSRARDLAKTIASGQGIDQVNRVAQDLVEWSQRSREWIAEMVQREVKRQLGAAGIATREDLDALRKRVRELEKASKGGGSESGASRRAGSAPKRATSPSTTSGTKPPVRKTPSTDDVATATEDVSGLGDPGPPSP